jgi:hypothetical protein
MKLIINKFKKLKRNNVTYANYTVEQETLFKDIPTLGIAFTCIDNWCSDNGRKPVTMNDITVDNNGEDITITTVKDKFLSKDEYDVVFNIKQD